MSEYNIRELGLELRKEFYAVDTGTFLRLLAEYQQSHNYSALVDALDMYERQARQILESQQTRLAQILAGIHVNTQHAKLALQLPEFVDLLHMQAIVVYGFLCPGRNVVYTSTNPISETNVHKNVRNKLVSDFSEKKFRTALEFCVEHGILQASGRKTDRALAFNINEHGEVTAMGRHIILEARKFLE